MGKIADFLLTDNWEEFQRVQLYKKLPKLLNQDLSEEQLKKIEEIIKNK